MTFGATEPPANTELVSLGSLFRDQNSIWNSSGANDSSKQRGYLIRDNYREKQYGPEFAQLTGSYRTYFPKPPILNKLMTMYIYSSRLTMGPSQTYDVQDGKLAQKSILFEIPIMVNQGGIQTWIPKYPERRSLGRGKVDVIDIQIKDRKGRPVNFHGAANNLTFVFEKWDKISLPIHREDHAVAKSERSQNMADAHFGERMQPR